MASPPSATARIGPGLSLYLDLLRLVAALEVMAFHMVRPGLGVAGAGWNGFGHEAVVIFFVLSGFVIRHAAAQRDPTLGAFALSRAVRVWSVALPCLALTWLFDAVGHRADASIYAGLSPGGPPPVRLAIGAAMLNEVWFQSVQILSNTPYWSIAYEVAYYALFGALFYLRGRRRLLAVAACALVAGPKILMLFPIWCMGWAASRAPAPGRGTAVSLLLFVQPLLVGWVYLHADLIHLGQHWLSGLVGAEMWRNRLVWSRYALSDTLLGASVALHLLGAKGLDPLLERALRRARAPIRFGAARSFTLYLLHQPAMLMVAALLPRTIPARSAAIAGATLLIVGGVAIVTEGGRGRLRRWIERQVRRFGRSAPALATV